MGLPNVSKLKKTMLKSTKQVDINICKMKALDALSDLLGLFKDQQQSRNNRLDKEFIYLLFDRLHSDIPIDVFFATTKLLDYYLPEWKNFASDQVIGVSLKRDSPEIRKWTKDVLKRDNNTCQDCGKTKNLHAHHIIHWSKSEALRANVDNGKTLCYKCHSKEHPELSPNFFKQ